MPQEPTTNKASGPEAAPTSLGQLQAWRALTASARERRRHLRLDVTLQARFLGADNREGAGTVRDITVGGCAIAAAERPPLHLPLIVYIDRIGRVEGTVVRHLDPGVNAGFSGFAVRFLASPAKTERLIEKITVLLCAEDNATPSETDQTERRAKPRAWAPGPAMVTLPGGRQAPCRVLDMSLTGLSVESTERPAVGSMVAVGRAKGRVVRHHDTGFAIALTGD